MKSEAKSKKAMDSASLWTNYCINSISSIFI